MGEQPVDLDWNNCDDHTRPCPFAVLGVYSLKVRCTCDLPERIVYEWCVRRFAFDETWEINYHSVLEYARRLSERSTGTAATF